LDNRLYRGLLVTLVTLLLISIYMTAYTYFTQSRLPAETGDKPTPLSFRQATKPTLGNGDNTSQPLFTYAFPTNPSNAREIAEQVIPLVANDTIREEFFINSLRCPRYYFKTDGGNLLQIIYCMEGQLYQIIYTMLNPPQLNNREYMESALHLLRRLINNSEATLGTELITQTYEIENKTIVVSIHQAVDGTPIEKTGIRITIDKSTGSVKRLIIYPIYRLNRDLPAVEVSKSTVEKIVICRDTPLYLAKINNQTEIWINILNMNITSTRPLC